MRTPLLLTLLAFAATPSRAADHAPNFIIIFCDDLGYGDLGCFGSQKNRTPNIDQLAEQGRRFTSFYSSSPVCTPSRASLMTGCYARRVGMHEDYTGHWVLIPRSRRGLNPAELTIAEALKVKGYATACIGKWHLGDQTDHLPTQHGFDYYFGIPYSNDMQQARRGDPPLPLVRQEQVIEAPAKQETLTQRYTKETIKFIESVTTKNKEQGTKNPFFIYLPHTFPHLPLFASKDFHGRSANGRYGDTIEEIDWSTGKIMDCLKRLKLTENTLVVFTSDNGSNGRNGGSNKPLSGIKGSTMEGGMRVPMIAHWPGHIKPGTECDALTTTMDLLPTLCSLAGADGPTRKIDGHNISFLLLGPESNKSPYDAFYYYRRRQLQAVRMGPWKYHLKLDATHPRWTTPDIKAKGRPARLYNLSQDIAEKHDLFTKQPGVVATLKRLANKAVRELGNDGQQGSEQRPAKTLATSKSMTLIK